MRKCIILFLITGIVWAQTASDKLVLKGGQKYLGEYSHFDKKKVYFKPKNALTSQPIDIKHIHTLKLKNGAELICNGIIDEWIFGIHQNNFNAEYYQKLTIEEKASYDAKNSARKWLFYPPSAIFMLSVSSGSYFVVTGQNPLESIPATAIATLSLLWSYRIFKKLDKKSIKDINSEEMILYEITFSRKFKEEKLKNIIKSTAIIGLAATLGTYILIANFTLSF